MPEGNPYSFRGISERASAPDAPEEIKEEVKKHFDRIKFIEEIADFEYLPDEETQQILETFNQAFQKLTQGTNLETFAIDIENIHAFPPEILEQYQEYNGDPGQSIIFSRSGEMYIPDGLPRERLLTVFSHEYMHLTSQLKQVAVIQKTTNAQGEDNFFAQAVYRTGVQQESDSGKQDSNTPVYGLGLNEAITEFLATKLRSLAELPDANTFSKKFKNEFGKEPSAYKSVIRVLQEVAKKYLNDNLDIGSPAFIKLVRLYVAGDPTFLQELGESLRNSGHKDGLKLLYQMDDSDSDAASVATTLGVDIKIPVSRLRLKFKDNLQAQEKNESPFENPPTGGKGDKHHW